MAPSEQNTERNVEFMPTLPRVASVATTQIEQAPSQPASSNKHIIREAFLFWVGTRVIYMLFTYLYVALIRNEKISFANIVQPWQYFDGSWYISASHGYPSLASTAFFPLLPVLDAVVRPLGLNEMVAQLIITNLFTLAAFIGIGFWASKEDPASDSSYRTLRMLVYFPYAFFLFAAYTESIFLTFVAFSFFTARKGQWLLTALLVFICGFSRPTAIILVPALAWEFGRQYGWWDYVLERQGNWRTLISGEIIGKFFLLICAVPAAFAIYMVYLWNHLGDPLAFLHAERLHWNIGQYSIPQALILLARSFLQPHVQSHDRALQFITLAMLAFGIFFTIATWRKLPFMYTLYMLGLLYLTLTDSSALPFIFYSPGRFMLTALPAFLLLAQWTRGRPLRDAVLINVFLLVQAVFVIAYISAIWSE